MSDIDPYSPDRGRRVKSASKRERFPSDVNFIEYISFDKEDSRD